MSSGRTAAETASAGGVAGGRFRWTESIVLFGILFLGVSDTQLIPPLLPALARDLDTSPGRAGTIVTVYAVAAAAFALLAGTASDRFGRKRLILFGLVGFAGASVLTFQAAHFSILLTARLLTGFSAGALSTLSLSYAADLYPFEHRGKAMGILSMAYFLAFVIGIPAGAVVTARADWRWVFASLAVGAAAMLMIAARLLPPDQARGKPVSYRSVTAHFRFGDRVAGILIAFLTSGGLVGFLTYVGVWLASQGVGIERIGVLFMVAGVAATAAAPASGWAADRIGKGRVIVGANVALAALFVLVSQMHWGILLFAGVGLLSITASARQAPLHALTTELVGPEARGSYVAVRNAASQLGIAGVAGVSGAAFDASGFRAVAWIAGMVTILIVPLCRWIPEPRRK